MENQYACCHGRIMPHFCKLKTGKLVHGMRKKRLNKLGVFVHYREYLSQYYYRMLQTQKKELVEHEMQDLTSQYQNDKPEFVKNPVITEFLGLSSNALC